MTNLRFGSRLVAVALGLMATAPSFAEMPGTPSAPTRPSEEEAPKTVVALLFAIHARKAILQDGTLVLTGVAPNAVVFADRPIRAAGHIRLSNLLEAWKSGDPIGFDRLPPNATVSVLDTGRVELATIVVVLKEPRLAGDRLTFAVERLDGDIAGAAGPASVFIQTANVPLARLAARRGG